jgi:hypothetical protein
VVLLATPFVTPKIILCECSIFVWFVFKVLALAYYKDYVPNCKKALCVDPILLDVMCLSRLEIWTTKVFMLYLLLRALCVSPHMISTRFGCDGWWQTLVFFLFVTSLASSKRVVLPWLRKNCFFDDLMFSLHFPPFYLCNPFFEPWVFWSVASWLFPPFVRRFFVLSELSRFRSRLGPSLLSPCSPIPSSQSSKLSCSPVSVDSLINRKGWSPCRRFSYSCPMTLDLIFYFITPPRISGEGQRAQTLCSSITWINMGCDNLTKTNMIRGFPPLMPFVQM